MLLQPLLNQIKENTKQEGGRRVALFHSPSAVKGLASHAPKLVVIASTSTTSSSSSSTMGGKNSKPAFSRFDDLVVDHNDVFAKLKEVQNGNIVFALLFHCVMSQVVALPTA
jgi:hypothetical protein